MSEKICVLDFGSQYCHLIARRIRQLNVYSEIMESNVKSAKLKRCKGIILSGGPSSVYDKNIPRYDKNIFNCKIPILAICYGHQLMVHEFGGEVKPGKIREYGIAILNIKNKDNLFKGLEDNEKVWMSHGDTVTKLPHNFQVIGKTDDCENAAIANTKNNFFGIQFHPEVYHTKKGMKILSNFLDICNCKRDWNMENYIEQISKEIKEKVKDKNVFMLISGGVDSTVTFTLLNRVLGEKRVYGLFINNGLIREDEAIKVKKSFENIGFKNFHVYDASNLFIKNLEGIYNPEEKRKIIGETFIKVANEQILRLNLDYEKWILGQGTIYPDTIETRGTKNAVLIKTHHNRVDAMQRLIKQGKVIEPLARLYKDEVRKLGIELGLAKENVYRHPFPGPGLGVRILCTNKIEKIKNKRKLEESINGIISKYNLKAYILPIKSVGVQGDFRTYKYPLAIEGNADWDILERISTLITNKFKEINRVILLLSPEKIINYTIKRSYITIQRLELARKADNIAMYLLKQNDIYDDVWQMPTVLVPLSIDRGESVILRPVVSREAMTANFYKMDERILNKIVGNIMEIEGIDAVFYDITNKPPATIEWE
jgi:GMP synthase (glutamine-hydrolysing)